jgi:hypothetical protein
LKSTTLTTRPRTPHKRWYVSLILMKLSLKLNAGLKLSVSKLHSIQNTERTNPFTWLRIPCKQIKITSLAIAYLISKSYTDISTCVGSGECLISSLIVIIYKRNNMFNGINPSVATPFFERCFRKQWIAVIRNSTITFKADFYNVKTYMTKTPTLRLKSTQTRKLHIFTEGPAPITLTKPFVFKQVNNSLYYFVFNEFAVTGTLLWSCDHCGGIPQVSLCVCIITDTKGHPPSVR